MDFLFAKIITTAVAIIFIVGFWQKIKEMETFQISLDAYELIPTPGLKYSAFAIVLAEGLAATLLLMERTLLLGAILGSTLLSIVTLAVVINLLRGNTDIGCGCGGIEDEQPISWALVTRNLILITGLTSVFFAGSSRILAPLDFFTLAAGSITFYGLYVLSSQLITNLPRLRALK